MATIYTRAGKGSALTWTEGDANITNLNTDKLEHIVSDTTPQLGGSLDVNGNSIVSVSNGNINIEPNGVGQVYLTTSQVRVGNGPGSTSVVTTNGASSLVLNTNGGTASGSITLAQGANANVTIVANSLGRVVVRNLEATSAGNANITITPDGTGQTIVKNLEYQEFVHSLGTTSGTIAPDAANGNVQTITLNGNLTINAFTNPVSGQSLTLIITTGGTGRTLTSTMLFAGGSKTLSTTSTVDILTISYIGTTYYASLVKDYK